MNYWNLIFLVSFNRVLFALCCGCIIGCSTTSSNWSKIYFEGDPVERVPTEELALIREEIPVSWNLKVHKNIAKISRNRIDEDSDDIYVCFYEKLSQSEWDAISPRKSRPGYYNDKYTVGMKLIPLRESQPYESPNLDIEAFDLANKIEEKLILERYQKK